MNCPVCTAKLTETPEGEPYCDIHGTVDPADVQLAEFEASHRVWFDDQDRPQGWIGFVIDAGLPVTVKTYEIDATVACPCCGTVHVDRLPAETVCCDVPDTGGVHRGNCDEYVCPRCVALGRD